MKTDDVEAIEIETNFGGVKKAVTLTGKTRKNIANILAGEAMKKVIKETDGEILEVDLDDTASTATIAVPRLITCPYCESQEIDCLSTEKITSQLTLFEGASVQTKTKVKSQDTFYCQKCGAIAKLSWREAKEEK